MWHNDKTVVATHTKNGTQNAWAIINGVGISGWISIRPASADGVTNVFMILCTALANNRKVDVLIENGQILEATLK
jgi:hypothetical protein